MEIYTCCLTDAGWDVHAGESIIHIATVLKDKITIAYSGKVVVGLEHITLDGKIVLGEEDILDKSSEFISSFVKYCCACDIFVTNRDALSRVAPAGGAITVDNLLTRRSMETMSIIFTSWMLSPSRTMKLLANSCLSFIVNFSYLFPVGEYRAESLSETISTITSVANFTIAMISRAALFERIALSSELAAIRLEFAELQASLKQSPGGDRERINVIEERIDNLESVIADNLL